MSPMKTPSLLLGFVLVAPLFAADSSKILLTGTSVSVESGKASGTAKAVVGEMTIAADVITFDRQANALRCDGAVTIRVSDGVVTGRDCVIELSPGEKKLFFLSRGEIRISPTSETRYFPVTAPDLIGSSPDREKLIPEFKTRMSSEKTPNKAPEPTSGSVTPRAR